MQHTLWIKLVAFTCGLVLICTTSCRSADSKVDRFQGLAKPTPPPGYQPAARQILTLLGESYSPQVSPGGERLVFIGKSRPTHEHGQVYEMSLSLKSEKRITFQDGTLESPSYFNDGKQILYASSTDEDKEYADVVLRNSSAEEPTTGFNQVAEKAVRPFSDLEIYSSYLDGSQIERLTISKKFDGAASVHPNGKFIVFSSLRSGSLQLYTLAFDSLKVRRLTQLPGNNYQAKYSRQGQHLAWVSVADDYKSSELQVSNARSIKPKSLLTKKAMGDLI